MGATDFYAYAKGVTPKEAFRKAVEAAQYEEGHGGYTGTIAEKHSFVTIHVPDKWKNNLVGYAELLLNGDDDRVSDKWGPAGCILLGSEPLTERKVYGVLTEKYKQEGTRKWETVFEVQGEDDRHLATKTNQTDADAFAKAFAKENGENVTVTIRKRLVNGNPEVAVFCPTFKEVASEKKMNTYLFFGIASN